MDTFLNNKLDRLKNFTASLAATVESAVPAIQQSLDGKEPLPKGCPSKEFLALMELARVEEKIKEVAAATAALRETLGNRHQSKRSR